MADRVYTIWIDGLAYGGEDPDVRRLNRMNPARIEIRREDGDS